MIIVLLALLQVGQAENVRVGAPRTYHARRGELAVQVPHLEGRSVVDGVLAEDPWPRAAVLTGFSQYSPVDGVAASDSTEIMIWYSDRAIHIGVRAFEPHGQVLARLADRDKINNDDFVQILLDTFNDGRRAMVFGVNPLGVQSDGVRIEGSGEGGRRFSAEEAEDPVDLSPDFLFESAGRLTEGGYEIELSIPFKSLRYRDAPQQEWGINVIRRVQHSGHLLTWTPTRRGAASFLAQSGVLQGLQGLQRGRVLDINPIATAKIDGTPTAGGWTYDMAWPEFGGNVRWGITSNLMLNGTVNPDFSQVEADVAQSAFDPRRAVFFPEKRFFFLEESERFETPNRLIYTRRITNPVAAGKVTGKLSGTDIGFLTAVDDPPLAAADSRPVFNVLRVQRDVAGESTVGIVYTDRVDGADYNRVAGADVRLVLGGLYTLSLQGAASFTRTDGGTGAGTLWEASFERAGRHFGWSANMLGIERDFAAESGFLSRVDVVRVRVSPRFTVFGSSDATLESWSGAVVLFGNWLYDDFFGGDDSEDLHLWLNNSFALRGGWRLDASLIVESFAYPAYLYEDYAVGRQAAGAVDTVAFVGTGNRRIPNYVFVSTITTPRFATVGGSVTIIGGRDENFDEWAPGYLLFVDGGIEWRPTEAVRVDVRYLRQQYIRPGDGTTVAVRDVPRLKVEYQLARSLFVRFVGQYDARFRDALRDDTRTGDPILIRNAETGIYERTAEQTVNDFRVDWLFSFQPSPGTVLFAGYGSSLTEPRSFRFSDLRRAADGFFMKVSYLFRL